MRSFIRHSVDGETIAERVEVSHRENLIEAGDGYVWTEVHGRAADWTIEPSHGGYKVAPFVRPPMVQIALAKLRLLHLVADLPSMPSGSGLLLPNGRVASEEALKTKIEAVETIEELETFASEAGWPAFAQEA